MEKGRNYEVIIIGGGIIGCSIASSLSRENINVGLIEKETIGAGSTSRALGGFRHQFSLEANIRLSIESIKTFKKFREQYSVDPELKFDGYSFLARTESELASIEESAKIQRKLGIKVDVKTARELKELFPYISTEDLLGGTICFEDGHAATSKILDGFVRDARRNGVDIWEHVEVISVKKRSKGYMMYNSSSRNEFQAKEVVISSGPYTRTVGKLFGVEIPVDPLPRQVFVTNGFQGMPKEMPIFIDVHNVAAVGREGNGILIGYEDPNQRKDFEMELDLDLKERTLELGVKIMPSLLNATIAYSIEGFYEVTPDMNPIIDEVGDSLFCAAGFSGHGFMHSPEVGKLMAEMITKHRPSIDLSSFRLHRFAEKKENIEKLRI